jgi:hypothetical protein
MNHAQYIKLRGVWARFAPPIPTVKWVTVGSTDFSMWNEWTIGKARYIDRDNGNGIFVEGEAMDDDLLNYTVGALALPKLWGGPAGRPVSPSTIRWRASTRPTGRSPPSSRAVRWMRCA